MSASFVQPSLRVLQFPASRLQRRPEAFDGRHRGQHAGDRRLVRLPSRRWLRLIKREQVVGGANHVR